MHFIIAFQFRPQEKSHGKIVDNYGFPVAGAKIKLRGTETITDFQGNFSLESSNDFYWKVEISSSYSSSTFFLTKTGDAGGFPSSIISTWKDLID